MLKRKMLLFPSMNCANFECLKEEVLSLNQAGADGYHCDISDGTFYPGWSMGLRDVQAIKKNTEQLVDVHLYVTEPSKIIEQMADAGADIFYVFAESEHVIAHTLYKIREMGKYPGLCIGWNATVETYLGLYPLIDYAMVNCTNSVTGKLEKGIYDRIGGLIKIREKYGFHFRILLDGGISREVIKKTWKMGVDGYAMGTNCLFKRNADYQEVFKEIRNIEGI